MTLTLRTRLAAISTIVFGLLFAAFSIATYEVLARQLDADITTRLVELTDGLHGYLRFVGDVVSVNFDAADADQAAFVHEATRYYQVYDADTGRLLVESSAMEPLGLEFSPDELVAFRLQQAPIDIETEYGRLRLSNSVKTTPGGRAYLLQVGASLAPMDASLSRYRSLLLWRVPLMLFVAILASWWLSGFALRPLTSMAMAVGQIDVSTLHHRLPLRGTNDELDRVATAFNDTLGDLDRAVDEMRQFSAALAHELRTPLAGLRGEIELALRAPALSDAQSQVFASQIEEIDRLTRLIDHILTLARAESGQIRLRRAPLNLGALASSITEQIEPMAEARSVALRCEQADGVVVDGDAGWLERLLLNLLDNALKFTRENGRVVVRISRERDAARLDVQDTGIGLSPGDRDQVFERFFRADQARSRSGAGLGLSLVRWIVKQHGGTVSVESRLGEGSTFTVRLPLSRA